MLNRAAVYWRWAHEYFGRRRRHYLFSPMKRFFLILTIAVAVVILSLVAYRGYWVKRSTSNTSTAVSSDAARAQGKLLAMLRFDLASFGECTVRDAWLEKSSTFVTRGWFGIRLGSETIPVTSIHVVTNMPKDPLRSVQGLSFEESNTAAFKLGLSGSFAQTVNINGEKYRLFDSNTVFPPPPVMKFSCGNESSNAIPSN